MARFLNMLFEEAGDEILDKDTVINKFNEAGVPITWSRLTMMKVHFEKKIEVPKKGNANDNEEESKESSNKEESKKSKKKKAKENFK